MRARSKWLRTDEYADAAESFRAAARFADGAQQNIREWKWLLIAGHSAVQSSLVISLSRGDFLQTLKQTNAREWLIAHESGGPWPAQLQLDYFLELYRKAKRHIVAGTSHGGHFTYGTQHDDAMRRLNDRRNGFIHFIPQGWSVELRGLPPILASCVDIARHLLWDSGAVVWPTDSLARRAEGSANHLAKSLAKLRRVHEP